LEEVLRVAPQYDTKSTGTDKATASLPTARPVPASQSVSAPAAADAGAATEPMILIIEDEEDTRAMIELLLKKSGYGTIAVADSVTEPYNLEYSLSPSAKTAHKHRGDHRFQRKPSERTFS
jgi:PleD family two-component response regulator